MIYKRMTVLVMIAAVVLAACSAPAPGPTQTPTSVAESPTVVALQPTNTALPAPTEAAVTIPTETAASGNVQPSAGNGDANCLVGTWAIADFDSYVRSLIPEGAFEDNTLQYDSTEGRILYTFSNDGKVTVKAQHYSTLFDVSVDPVNMKLAVTMDGSTTGNYSVKDNRVSIDKVTDDQMTFAAVLDGTPMLTASKLSDFGPLFVPPNNYADFQCSGDKLSLMVPNLPSGVSAINFKRLGN